MARVNHTKTCLTCKKSFSTQSNNHHSVKFCSVACRKKHYEDSLESGSVERICLNCGKPFSHYASQGPGKYCSRSCKKEHWKTPSAERGFIDLVGLTFNRLTVISYAGVRHGKHHAWRCRCSCPEQTELIVPGHNLKGCRTQSCGCLIRGVGIPKPETKECRRCHQSFPFTEEHFVKKPRFRWGLAPCCKECWKPIRRERHLRWRRNLKLEVISHYSKGKPKCSCCGETHIEFLTLDHINDDGKEDRRIHGIGMVFYSKMKKLGYPSHLQVLCFNCNIARALFGKCPHTI